MDRASKSAKIGKILDKLYPKPPIPLNHEDPYTLLVAVMLSAQTTDKKVNQVTPALFKHANTIKFDNDFSAFSENRDSQKIAWKENQKYFLDFLKENRLSKLYAYGSYYYLLYKILRFRDLNFNLLLSYLIFYPYNILKKIIKSILSKE